MVELLPETVQQKVRSGEIPAHAAMKVLVPMARANIGDCQRMAEGLAKHRFTSRQAGQLYAAWRDARWVSGGGFWKSLICFESAGTGRPIGVGRRHPRWN